MAIRLIPEYPYSGTPDYSYIVNNGVLIGTNTSGNNIYWMVSNGTGKAGGFRQGNYYRYCVAKSRGAILTAQNSTVGVNALTSNSNYPGYFLTDQSTQYSNPTLDNYSSFAAAMSDVEVFFAPGHPIIYQSTNGTISGPSSASDGEMITLTITPDTGYALSSIAIYKTASQDPITYTKVNDTTYTFTMPDVDVTVTGVFARVYAISIATSPTSGGTVSGLPSTALPGTTVTFAVTPATNFQLASYEFTGADVTFDRDTMTGSFVMSAHLI